MLEVDNKCSIPAENCHRVFNGVFRTRFLDLGVRAAFFNALSLFTFASLLEMRSQVIPNFYTRCNKYIKLNERLLLFETGNQRIHRKTRNVTSSTSKRYDTDSGIRTNL